jgi:hypothetical protein
MDATIESKKYDTACAVSSGLRRLGTLPINDLADGSRESNLDFSEYRAAAARTLAKTGRCGLAVYQVFHMACLARLDS